MKKKLCLLFALMMTVGVLAMGCGGNDDDAGSVSEDTSLTDIQAKGVLVLGCDDEFPPMGFVDEDGNLTGFDIELAEMVCEKMGVTLEATPIDWSTKEAQLNGGSIDVIWNGYTMTQKRDKKVEFTKPYLNNEVVIAVKADSDIQSLEDLAGKVIASQTDSTGLAAVNKNEFLVENAAEIREFNNFTDAMLDLQSVRVDAVAIDKVVVNYMMQQTPGVYRLLDESLGDELYGIGCKKDAVALREAIDTALDELYADGSIEELSNKYFGTNVVIRDIEKLATEEIELVE